MTPFWIGWEACLCLLMLASLAVWFWYAIQLVQEDVFYTRWVQSSRQGSSSRVYSVEATASRLLALLQSVDWKVCCVSFCFCLCC